MENRRKLTELITFWLNKHNTEHDVVHCGSIFDQLIINNTNLFVHNDFVRGWQGHKVVFESSIIDSSFFDKLKELIGIKN